MTDPYYRRFVSFGELLIRLSSGRGELLSRARSVAVDIGGSEANVAATLAGLGHGCAMISTVPVNALGDAAVMTLRSAGVDCSNVITSDGRMGLYWLETGAGGRASDVIYDREASSFSCLSESALDWRVLLADADRLHLSGITVALNATSASIALAAAARAKEMGVPVSFDGNYRERLWRARGNVDRAALCKLAACADIFLGNYRDINLLLGTKFDGDNQVGRRAACEAAFVAFPALRLIASTLRTTYHTNRHGIAVRVDTPDNGLETDVMDIPSVVDRIGTGDAFAAGILHADRLNYSLADIAAQGRVLCALKHTIGGDFGNINTAHVRRFAEAGS
ncbi:sugar kinase, partial [Sphingomonas sp. NFX23]|uniref:sugar kinase n=1 Tax=Sphingomonas sp. NFX23 TaxID=2819532 RepID=UPI003CE6788B